MMESVRETSDKCKKIASNSKDKGKKDIVYFITSDKVIQAVMTASAFAVVASAINNFALVLGSTFDIPQQPIILVSMIIVFRGAMWVDNNTDEWRNIVEEATGEEVEQ